MILIADSGSTKTDWALASSSSSNQVQIFHTQGINPFHQSPGTIAQILNGELLTQLENIIIERVFFYGSGVRPELVGQMRRLLSNAFPQAVQIEACNDMLGAARALCVHNTGIASILGTGANSCLYDGMHIIANTPALGYVLGDEGSGAVLGKRLVHEIYKGVLSEEIRLCFEAETGLSMAAVIDRVYRQPLPNRFLASLSTFVHRHLDRPELHRLVVDNFEDFFRINIAPYQRPDLHVGFVGSIAWHYRLQLQEAASRQGVLLGTVVQSPLEGLCRYHSI